MIAMLVAFLTNVMWNALRQMRLFNTVAPAKTIERGIQSEHNPVDSIVILTSVYGSLRGVNAVTRQGSAKGCRTCR